MRSAPSDIGQTKGNRDMTEPKTALVTGANKGIGHEVVRRLARDGYRVWLGSRDKQRGERAVAQYRLAIETGDNTDGAINQARELMEHTFEWPANQ